MTKEADANSFAAGANAHRIRCSGMPLTNYGLNGSCVVSYRSRKSEVMTGVARRRSGGDPYM